MAEKDSGVWLMVCINHEEMVDLMAESQGATMICSIGQPLPVSLIGWFRIR